MASDPIHDKAVELCSLYESAALDPDETHDDYYAEKIADRMAELRALCHTHLPGRVKPVIPTFQ